MVFLGPLRSREWDNIITAHKGRSSLFSWNYIKKALGSKELESTDPSGAPFERVLISPCGNFAVGGAVDGWLEKFNIQSGSSRGVYRGHTGAITGIVTDSTGSTLITTSLDGTLRFWDFDACTELASVPLGMPASFLRMNRDNNLIAVATDDACVRIYDASTRKLARRFEGHTGHITDIAFSEDGRWLISAAADYTIRTWDLPSGKMVDWFATRRPATSIAFSPTGDFLATTHAGRLGIFLWANKAYFSSVILHRPPPLPTQLSLPSRAGPALQSGEESTAAIPQAEEEEEEEGGESESESESDAESESEAVPKPDVAAHSGYISLSELAPAKWQNIDSLDLIKERNRPIKAPEPVQVPFFMPTVPGLEPKFAPVAQEEGSDVAAANAKDEAKSKVLTKKTNSVLDTSSFTNLVTSGKCTLNITFYTVCLFVCLL